jgi:hypothetical protein
MYKQNECGAEQCNASNDTKPRFTLAAYLAAGVGLAGLAPAADAAIVTIDITNPNISGPNAGISPGGYLNVNNWVLGSTLSLANNRNSAFGLGGINIAFGISSYQYASPLNVAAGTVIDANTYFSIFDGNSVFKLDVYDYYYKRTNTYTSPDFGPGSYLPFYVIDSSSNAYYGWIEITWSGSTNTWEILSAAYESQANTAILAGNTGSVSAPAPSPASLLALIVGGAALRQWRQRRRETRRAVVACS